MGKNKLSYSDTAEICRGLALMLHAGIDMGDGLFLLAQERPEQSALVTGMGKKLVHGLSLSAAMQESGAFDAYVTGMCRVGEENGRLEEALNAVAAHYEQQGQSFRRIRSALTYPLLVLLLMLIVIAVLLTQVLPIFDRVYAGMGSGLGGLSAKLLQLGQLINRAMPVLLALLLLAALAVLALMLSARLRCLMLSFFKKHFGDSLVLKSFNNARFVSAMAMGISSGQDMESALKLAATLFDDIPGAYARVCSCIELVQQGRDITQAMPESGLLSAMEARMLEVSRRAGKTEQFMTETATKKMDAAYDALDTLVSGVEPAIVLLTALLVGLILLSVMLPLMNIMTALG